MMSKKSQLGLLGSFVNGGDISNSRHATSLILCFVLVFSNKESPGFLKLVRLEVFAPKLDQVVSLLPKVP